MKEALIHGDVSLPTHHEATEISEPGERSFDFPSALVASQLAPVLQRRLYPVLSLGANQLDTTPGQALAQRIRVAGFIVDRPFGVLPWAPRWAKKARQALSHTSCSSQSRRRRQQVLGDGKRSGRSGHRAPVRKIQRMPSKTGRFGMGFGPPRGEALSSGNKGAIFSHCASVSSDCFPAIGRDSFRPI
jgi:hypothetical protein